MNSEIFLIIFYSILISLFILGIIDWYIRLKKRNIQINIMTKNILQRLEKLENTRDILLERMERLESSKWFKENNK